MGSGRGCSVALVGADGAGKSTVGRRLPETLGVPAIYLYMGVNLEASDRVLPPTRLLLRLKRRAGGRPDLAAGTPGGSGGGRVARGLRAVKAGMRLLLLLGEEWSRQLVAWRHLRRGEVVVFDRHFYADYRAHDVAAGRGAPLSRRIHGFLLRRFYPRPDVVVCLDAPAEVLLARKQEGTLESVERRRREYLALADEAASFAVVDVTRPLEDVLAEVTAIIERLCRAR